MNWLVDTILVAAPLALWCLVRAQARANRNVTRRRGYVIGGPETRIDRGEDQ